MIYMFVFSFVGTVAATFFGSLLGVCGKKISPKIFLFLQNFSVGALLAFLFIELLGESFEHFFKVESNSVLSALYVLLIVAGTGLLFFLCHELVHRLSHHHRNDDRDEHSCSDHGHAAEILSQNHSLLATSFIFLGAIFVHNIPEGLVLGISFVEADMNALPLSGIILACVMFIHNLIIGFSMSVSFCNNHQKSSVAILWSTISSLPAYILAIVGYFLGRIEINDLFVGVMLSISCGSLFYVLLIELLPQIYYEYKSKYSFLFVLLGFAVLSVVLFL